MNIPIPLPVDYPGSHNCQVAVAFLSAGMLGFLAVVFITIEVSSGFATKDNLKPLYLLLLFSLLCLPLGLYLWAVVVVAVAAYMVYCLISGLFTLINDD
jgi:hypothetical protein